MGEKLSIGTTKEGLCRGSPLLIKPVLLTASPAEGKPLTGTALIWKCRLPSAEIPVGGRTEKPIQRLLHKITQACIPPHEEVTGIYTTIMFYDQIALTSRGKDAKGGTAINQALHHRIEETYGYAFIFILPPEVEKLAKEITVTLGCSGEGG